MATFPPRPASGKRRSGRLIKKASCAPGVRIYGSLGWRGSFRDVRMRERKACGPSVAVSLSEPRQKRRLMIPPPPEAPRHPRDSCLEPKSSCLGLGRSSSEGGFLCECRFVPPSPLRLHTAVPYKSTASELLRPGRARSVCVEEGDGALGRFQPSGKVAQGQECLRLTREH